MIRLLLPLISIAALAADVDPTFLRASIGSAKDVRGDLTASGAQWCPLFERGGIVRGVSRYGVVRVARGSATARVKYDREEEIYFVVDGTGQVHYEDQTHPLKKGDFLYLAPGIEHGLAASAQPLEVVVMGFRVPASVDITVPDNLPIANIAEVKRQTVGNHPPSTLYQLLLGDRKSTRDRLAAAHTVTSLFIMEIAPSGTNTPHHHDREEEIYLLLDGAGEMVAGGGANGVEGRHAASAGDAFFVRLNATVGFYNGAAPGTPTARILAVRSLYPFGR